MPESLDQLTRAGADKRKIRAILAHIDRRLAGEPEPAGFTTDREEQFSAVGSLFQNGRTVGTLILWFVFMLNLAEFYGLQSWLPTILTNHHYPLTTVATATSLTTTGGIIAAFVVGPAMDRIGAYGSLACLYLTGVVFVALAGMALEQPEWVLLGAAFWAGFCVSGGQKGVIALAALFYPAPVRSTGVGWALGVGRVGGIAGPTLIGMLLDWNFAAQSVFFAAAIPMLLAAAAVALMGVVYGKRGAVAQAVP